MNTKRKVKDYMGQDVAIYCSSKEEWDKIVDLLPSNRSVKKNYWQNSVNNGKSDTINSDGCGWSPKEHFIKKNYTIYPAFDFLEEDKPLWFKNYDSVAHFVKKSPHRNSFFKETDKIKTEVISEYVEATSKFDCYIIPGYVYKVTDKTNIKSLQLECNIHTGKYSSGTKLFVGTHEFSFKESTKEAYEAQNKPKQLAGNNLLPNKIYVTDDTTDYIFKTSETSKGYSHYICKFKCFRSILNKDYIWRGNLRLATKEEEKWLNTCILQNKFIPKEDLHLYDDYGLLVKTNEKVKSLLEEAKERYPIGTKFIDLVNNIQFTVKSHNFENFGKETQLYIPVEINPKGNKTARIYHEGKWAEIVSDEPEINTYGLKVGDILKKEIINAWAGIKGNFCPDVQRGWVDVFDRYGEDRKIEDFRDIDGQIGFHVSGCTRGSHYLKAEGFKEFADNFYKKEVKSWIQEQDEILDDIIKQHPLTPKECYPSNEIIIPQVIKSSKKQFKKITIESPTELDLKLKTIKPKQIQTIKI